MNTQPIGKIVYLDYDFLLKQYEDPRPVCLTWRERQMLISQLEYAKWRARWKKASGTLSDGQWNIAESWTHDLIAKLIDDADCDTGKECQDYPPSATMIDIQPANPFTDPEEIPDGWAYPPFWVYTDYDPVWSAAGAQVGDMITDIGRFPGGGFPPAPITSGLARFRVTVRGGDELEIHLFGFPSAGYVWIAKNDDPLTLETYDLNVDLLNVPPEIGEVTIWQWDVEGDPEIDQHVDVTFIPSLGDEIIPFRYGGGLRKITLCRAVEDSSLDVRQNPDNLCLLDKREDGGEWETFADITLCPRVSGGLLQQVLGDVPEDYDPQETIPPPRPLPDGMDEDDARCYASNNAAAIIKKSLDDIRNAFDQATDLTSLILLLLTVVASLLGFFWLAAFLAVTFALLGVSWEAFGDAFTGDDQNDLVCILYNNSYIDEIDDFPSFYVDEIMSEIQDKAGYASNQWGAALVLIYLLSNEGLRHIGSLPTGADYDCANCLEEWCYEWTTFGEWTIPSGYAQGSRTVAMYRSFSEATVTHIEFHYTWNLVGGGGASARAIWGQTGFGGSTIAYQSPLPNVSPSALAWDGSATMTGCTVAVNATTGSGRVINITKILLRGVGENPFGADNCE